MAEQWKCYTKLFRDTWIHLLHSDVNLQVSDGTIPGLFLRYSASTRAIRFFLGCKIDNKKCNLYIGRYNDYSIKDIREMAWNLRRQIANGQDPRIEKQEQQQKEQAARGEPFADMFEQYMDKYAKLYKKPRTQDANQSQYRLYLAPIFGKMYMRQIEEKHVMDAYAKWVKRTSFSTASYSPPNAFCITCSLLRVVIGLLQ